MQEQSGLKEGLRKVGRGLRYTMLPVGLWRIGSDAIKSIGGTADAAKSALKSALQFEDRRDTWRQAVLRWQVTEEMLRKQVRVRQMAAAISAFFMLLGLYGVAAWGSVLPGFCCFALATVYYLQAVLRLHQIRNRDLCSFTEYVRRCTRRPSEFLPMSLPQGWRIL